MKFISNELLYWRSNPDWYGIKENGEYYLTESAPDEAKESFEKYQKAFEKGD